MDGNLPFINTVKPFGPRIVVHKPQPLTGGNEIQVAHGLVIPAQSDSNRRIYGLIAEVISVGPGVDRAIKPGGRIIVNEFAGTPIWDGERETPYFIIGEGEVMAYVDE